MASTIASTMAEIYGDLPYFSARPRDALLRREYHAITDFGGIIEMNGPVGVSCSRQGGYSSIRHSKKYTTNMINHMKGEKKKKGRIVVQINTIDVTAISYVLAFPVFPLTKHHPKPYAVVFTTVYAAVPAALQ